MRAQNTITAGLFISITLVAFFFLIFLLGKERHIFSSQEEYASSFRNVSGLVEGAPVRLGGIAVGRVRKIGFSNDIKDPTVHVRFLVEAAYLDRIRKDAEVSIETQGLLGDKFLQISTGTASEPMLSPGSYMKGREPADVVGVLSRAQEVVDNTASASRSLSELADKLKKDTVDNITTGSKHFANITREIEQGNGFIHRLIYSKEDGDKLMDSLVKASQNLDSIMKEVKEGKGALHALIYDPKGEEFIGSITTAAKNIGEAIDNINKIAAEVKDGKGLLHELIYKESPDVSAKIKSTIEKIDTAATALKSAAQALSNGEGTLGALLVDARLYENLVEVTDGAKRSFLLKQAIRKSLSK